MARVYQPGGPRDFGEAMVYAHKLEMQRDSLRQSLEECLDALIGCAVPAGGCDDKKHILDAQRSARVALKEIDNG